MTPIQFIIPNRLSNALPIESVKPRARAASVENATIEYSLMRGRPGELHITCEVSMARFLITELDALADLATRKQNRQLLDDCRKAIASACAAIEDLERNGDHLRRRNLGLILH